MVVRLRIKSVPARMGLLDGTGFSEALYVYGLATELLLTESFRFVAEAAGVRHVDRDQEDPLSGLFGGTWRLSEQATLDGGAWLGLTGAAPRWTPTLGLSLGF